jgi:DNA-binding response OmpR family regulator
VALVIVADDGASSVDLCREHSPDLALIDMYMPRQDGIDIIRKPFELKELLEAVEAALSSGE